MTNLTPIKNLKFQYFILAPTLFVLLFISMISFNIYSIIYYDYHCNHRLCSSEYTYNAYVKNILYNESTFYYPINFIIYKHNKIINNNYQIHILKHEFDKLNLKIGDNINLYKDCEYYNDDNNDNNHTTFYLTRQEDLSFCNFNAVIISINLVILFLLSMIIVFWHHFYDEQNFSFIKNRNKFYKKLKKKIKKFFKRLWKKMKKCYYNKNKNKFTEMTFVSTVDRTDIQEENSSSNSDDETNDIENNNENDETGSSKK